MRERWSFGKVAVASIVYNEEVMIEAWLDHLLESKNIDLISLTDCGSTDGTLDIIKKKIKENKSRIVLFECPWEFNFSKLRNFSIGTVKEFGFDWALWIDVDTVFNKNPDILFKSLEAEMLYLYDDIRIPTIRFWNLETKIQGQYSVVQYKGMVRLSSFVEFKEAIDEELITTNNRKLWLDLNEGFFLGHYDLARLNKMAKIRGVSVNVVMGEKKRRILEIRKLIGKLSKNDPDPASMTNQAIEDFGKLKIEDEINNNPRSVWTGAHSKFLINCL